jgi:hypothetical protein
LTYFAAIPGLTFLQRAFPEIEQITSRSGNHHPILGLKSRWFPLKISKPGIAVFCLNLKKKPNINYPASLRDKPAKFLLMPRILRHKPTICTNTGKMCGIRRESQFYAAWLPESRFPAGGY